MRHLSPKVKHKVVISGLAMFIFLLGFIVVNVKTNLFPEFNKKIGEVAGVAVVGVDKFFNVSLSNASATAPYQNVSGDVAISGNLATNGTTGDITVGTTGNRDLSAGRLKLNNSYVHSWGNSIIDGRVWSSNANIHLSPPNGSNVVINTDYRDAGGTTGGAAGLVVTGAITAGDSVGVGTGSPNGKLDVYNSGNNGDGAVFAPDITTDNNFTIQTYIDANIGGGGWGGRTTYATGCCNNLALQPNVGTVSIGGTSTNYGSDKLTVHGNATFGGRIAFANNVWQTSADGYNRFHFTANSRSYFGSQDGYVWRSNSDADLMTLSNSGQLGIGKAPDAYLSVRGDGTSPNQNAFAVGAHNVAWAMIYQGTQRLCHNGADGAGLQAVVPQDCNSASQVDLAEFYDTDGTLEPGDIVTIDKNNPSSNKVVKSSKANQILLTGVVSTNPTADGILGFRVTSPNRQPIALAGRIPVKVSLENGPVKTGDPLISSSIPGVAMKAGIEGGHIIGVAMENYDGTIPFTELTGVEENDRNTFSHAQDLPHYNSDPTKWPAGVGKIMVFMNLTDYNPDLSPASALNLKIREAQNSQIIVQNEKTGDIFDKIGAFAEIIAGKIQAGIIETKQLIVNGVNILERLDAQQKEIDALKAEIELLKNK